jgi:hypothetical protein
VFFFLAGIIVRQVLAMMRALPGTTTCANWIRPD